MKQNSVAIAFGTYSHATCEVFVVRISQGMVRTMAWHAWANPLPGNSRQLNLKQIRSNCIVDTRELAAKYDAHFGGVRQLVFSELVKELAERNNVSEFGLRDIFERAQAAFGGTRRAAKWLESPCQELKGQLPMELIRKQSGRWKLENLLLRMQFKHLIRRKSQFVKVQRQSNQ